jgi:hypothetical protein
VNPAAPVAARSPSHPPSEEKERADEQGHAQPTWTPCPAGTGVVNAVRQLAQAVLGLGLLSLVVRLLVAAISDHHPAADPNPPRADTAGPGLPWVRDQRGGGVLPGGDVGGDAQLDESFSVRFHHRHRPGAMVTYCYYAALDLDDLTTIYVERQTEYMVCTDPADPGGTEVWSDYRYAAVQRDLGSVEAATATARRAAEAHLACDEHWPGQPSWQSE